MAGLTRSAGAVLHHQLFSILRTGILSGRYRAGDLLPTEEELSQSYRVSRATVRRAMQTLDAKGMIERCPGIGTRVLTTALPVPGASAEIDLVGTHPDAGELVTQSFEMVPAPASIAEALDLGAGEVLLRIVRLRVLDGIRVRMTTHYIPAALGRRLEAEMLGQRQILDILADLGASGHSAQDTISAMLADAIDADLLSVEVGSPLLDMVRVVRTKDGEAILLQNTIVPPERQKLHIHVECDETGISPLTALGRRMLVR